MHSIRQRRDGVVSTIVVLFLRPNGDRYEGWWIEDKMQGKGTFCWDDGSTYTGYWVGGKRNGKGKFQFV